jgi:aminoglycoside phosphotransferase (APT) family kinase protein
MNAGLRPLIWLCGIENAVLLVECGGILEQQMQNLRLSASEAQRSSAANFGPLLAKGATAEIFACGDRHVLKLFLAGRPLRKARYEAHVGALIRAAGVPSPAVLALTEHEGRGGVIYERVAGPSMDVLLARAPWRLAQLAWRFAAVHAALHRASVPGLPAHQERIAGRIRVASLLPDRVRERALSALSLLPAGAALCHGDFHPGNLLLAPSGPAVIDWENAALGDPHADVARTLLLLRYAHLYRRPGAARVAMRACVALFGAAYLRRYRQLTGASRELIARWQLPLVAVRLGEGVPTAEERALLQLSQQLTR